jgi:hypothetical protein
MARKKAAEAEVVGRIRDRVKEFRRVRAGDLEVNPKNWRTHPRAQREAMQEVLDEVGVADALIVYPVGGGRYRLIDGHLRKDLLADQMVPVLITDLTEEEADKLLLVLDPLAAMAGADSAKTRELLASVEFDGEGVKDLLDNIGREYALIAGEKTEEEVKSRFTENEDGWKPPTEVKDMFELREVSTFPSSNRWGIPDLRPDMLCETFPTKVFGGDRLSMPKTKEECDQYLFICGNTTSYKPEGGYLGFYVFDTKFEKVWDDALTYLEDLHRLKWAGVLSPDFSTWDDDPPAVRIWQIYRSRWVARFWQEVGHKVIPSIQTYPKWFDLGPGGGIPVGTKVVSLQCRTKDKENVPEPRAYLRLFAEAIDAVQPEVVLVYGGRRHTKEVGSRFPKGPEYILLPSYIDERNKFLGAKRNQKPA